MVVRKQRLTVQGKKAYLKLISGLRKEGKKFTSTRRGNIYHVYPKGK